jgi:hypothetical protein
MVMIRAARIALIAALLLPFACKKAETGPAAPGAAPGTASSAAASAPASGTPGASARTPLPRITTIPTLIPTPEPPERIEAIRRGGRTMVRSSRFPSSEISFSRLNRIEEVDLNGDGDAEFLVEGIGTIQSLPPGIPTSGVVSTRRLPFESPLLAVLHHEGAEWRPIFVGHVPLACGQTGEFAACDQVLDFRTIRFRYDDRPQVLVRIQHRGEAGTLEVSTFRLNESGTLDTTFSASQPRTGLEVDVDPFGIRRRVAVDTFVNKQLAAGYRSFTLSSNFIFGERKFRVYTETAEEMYSDRGDVELSYWGLVHQPVFREELEKLRRQTRQPGDDDPVKVVQRRYPDARNVRLSTKRPGLAVVLFERPGCAAHAVLYQPLRESQGDGAAWDVASIRGAGELPYECLAEPPVSVAR